MSVAVEEGNNDEKSKMLTSGVDELGFTKTGSILSSLISATEKDKLSEAFDPSSCQECKVIMEKKSELRKQSLDLKQSVLEHKQLEHGLQVSETKTEKPPPRDPPTRDLLDIFKSIKYTGNLFPLSNRLPDSRAIQNGVQPPMPGVKRLKGDMAKSVGNKIDGCDWYIFHPYVDVSLPEDINKDGGLKQT